MACVLSWRPQGRIACRGLDPENLRLKGHQIEVWEGWDWRAGGVVALRVDSQNGVRSAGANPRRENHALAW